MPVYDINGNVSTVYDIDGNELDYAYDGDGNVIYTKSSPVPPVDPKYDFDRYTVTDLFNYGLSNSQAFAVYDGKIAQVKQSNAIHIIDIQTGTKIKEVAMATGHGNSCQFSDEFYEEDDEFPLFYVRNDGVWMYRINGTSSELIKKYAFSSSIIGTYVAGFGVDSNNKRFYTLSYSEGDYSTKTGLLRICVWDMDDETDNGNGTYSFGLLDTKDLTWFDKYQAIQGCCYHDGYLFVATGQANPQKVAIIDVSNLTIEHTLSFSSGGEIEGCAWVGNDYMIVGQNPNSITYKKVEFATV